MEAQSETYFSNYHKSPNSRISEGVAIIYLLGLFLMREKETVYFVLSEETEEKKKAFELSLTACMSRKHFKRTNSLITIS